MNAPGNSSGALYTREQLLAIAEVLCRYPGVMVLSDVVSAEIRYTAHPYQTMAAVAPDLRDRILIVEGVSKVYAMTGWRVG